MNKSMSKIILFGIVMSFVTLGYQNCSDTQFSATQKASSLGAGLAGQLGQMDSNGNISGELTLTDCPDEGCPDSLDIDIEANDGGNQSSVGQTTATIQNQNNDGGGNSAPATYTFTYVVPQSFHCQVVLAYTTNPNNGLRVLIPVGVNFNQWGGDASCSGTATPMVNLTDITQDGAYVSIVGQCTSGVNLSVSGNISNAFDDTISCENGAFQYCARFDQHGNGIGLSLGQSLNSQVAEDSEMFNVTVPGLIALEITNVVVSGNTATTTVKCMPGAKVTFNIYNSDQAKVDCGSSGEIVQNVTLLNVNTRILYVTQSTPFGITSTVQINVDSSNHTPSCSIASATGDNFCGARSGDLTGSCEPGWPVYVKVDGKVQNVVICSGQGNYTAERVILSDDAGGSSVMVEQFNPLNASKKCSATSNMSQF